MTFSLMTSLIIGLLAVVPVQATFVVSCNGRLFDQRFDPIVQPGAVSSHAHVICGGNGFNSSMDFNDARNSVCSSCNIKQDMSVYWTPKLYYRNPDGTFRDVPIMGDDDDGNKGGMNVYYLHRPGPDNDKIHPFPPGFRMIAGDPYKRTPGTDFNSKAISARCLGRKAEGSDKDLETLGFPNVTCPDGIRMQVTFPGCWNGKDADSPDHVSHTAYPKDGGFDGGRCPATHPYHIMTVFFEVGYQTQLFPESTWWDNGAQPFILATGDPTGYGMHGDFLSGWDPATLEKAINDCTDGNPDCPDKTFSYWTVAQQQRCKLPPAIDEAVQGLKLPSLPGCNPLSTDMATAMENGKHCNNDVPFNPSKERPLPPINGWDYLGCGNDDPMSTRTFPDEHWLDPAEAMTHQKCVDHCDAGGYTYAGLEYGNECWCGNSLATDRMPWTGVWGNCVMQCQGNATMECGGNGAISIYKKSKRAAALLKARRFARAKLE